MPTEYGLSNPKSSVPCTTSLEKPVGNVNPFPGRVKWGGGRVVCHPQTPRSMACGRYSEILPFGGN